MNSFHDSIFEDFNFNPYFQVMQSEFKDQPNLENEEKEENDFFSKTLFHTKEISKIKESTHETEPSIKEENALFKVDKILGNKTNRGKMPKFKKVGIKNHDKYDIDNIITVVQCHYMNFIVDFINFVLEEQGINEKFVKIAYEEKRIVNNQNFEKLKEKCLYEILKMKITPKCSKYPENHNKILYDKVKELPVIKDILNLNYLYFFQNVYYKSERNIKLNIEGMNKTFILSNKKLVLYNEKLSGFSDEYYISLFNRYVKEKYFEN
jgi:hypothetical protein